MVYALGQAYAGPSNKRNPTMTLEITKRDFEQLIDDRDNGVVALSGKWGTGKSHMWQEVQRESTNEAIKNALYVSLFGVKDILQLKLRLVQSALPNSTAGNTAKAMAVQSWKAASAFAKSLSPRMAALDEIALLAVPALLRGKLIVIDDIERKHSALLIEEVMGFIDEFTQVHNARILLILNSDKLADKPIWDQLREKVIDHEIALETTPGEAFAIALCATPCEYAMPARAAVEACGISNIRIINKILRTVNRLLSGRNDLTEEIVQKVVPSTVLLTALHNGGIANGPDLDFVLSFNSTAYYLQKHAAERDKTSSADMPNHEWATLLQKLNFDHADDFDELVAAFLKTGLLDRPKLEQILDRFVREKDAFVVQARCREFTDNFMWQPDMTDEQLLVEGTSLAKDALILDGYSVSGLFYRIAELPGGQPVADQLISDWIERYRLQEPQAVNDSNYFKKRLHPEIQAEFATTRAQLNPVPTLTEALATLIDSNGWNEREEIALKAATEVQFEAAIRSLKGEPLRDFIIKNLELYRNRQNYEKHFGGAMEAFAGGCRAICNAAPEARLSKTLSIMFEEFEIASLLKVYTVQPAAVPAPIAA